MQKLQNQNLQKGSFFINNIGKIGENLFI
jgi:hypothetical protein